MVVQLGGILVHHFLRQLDGVVRLDPLRFILRLLHRLIDEEILDRSLACRSLVDSEGGAELTVLTYLDRIQQ